MRTGFRAVGWILLALAVLAVAVTVSVGALRAHGATEFNRWVGWATVAAVPLAAAGVLLLLWDKITGSLARSKMSPDNGQEVSDSPKPNGPDRSGDTLPLGNPTFTGRTEALEALGRRLAAGPVSVVALRGLGGVGKSQLALEYAHRMRQSGRYQLAGWVRADSAVTIAEDLAALAPLLGLSVEGTVGEIVRQVVGALGTRRDWLVVFDNAQRPGDLVGMLPGGRGHVLITSRKRVWSGVATQIDLGEFSPAEAVEFLRRRSMILGVFQLRLWKLKDALTSFERAMPILLAADESYHRRTAEADIDWNVIERQKIFGFVYFVFVLYATVRTGPGRRTAAALGMLHLNHRKRVSRVSPGGSAKSGARSARGQ